MGDVLLKSESLPTRCDICHQSDLFDANNNYCSRCSMIKITAKELSIINNSNGKSRKREIIENTIKGAIVVGTIFGAIVGMLVSINGLST